MVGLTINDQRVEVEAGTKLLRAIEKLGIKVPTLCDHKALSPYGACRLCVVEVSTRGRSAEFQASCSYPVQEGLNVSTDTERIKRARKITAELLLARCPESENIQRIAADMGVKEPRIRKKNDDCVYCGLCVRMCAERMGRGAVGFSGRGPRKKLESPFGKHNEMCWACGACNYICPVGKKVSTLTTPHTLTPIPNSFNLGLDQRAAAYILFPQAVPNKATIDPDHCLHLKHGVCGVCQDLCEAKAINYEQKEEKIELNVGAVILSPGYEIFDARVKPEYGYGRFPNVVSALEFERILSASGPFSGHVQRPSDGVAPGGSPSSSASVREIPRETIAPQYAACTRRKRLLSPRSMRGRISSATSSSWTCGPSARGSRNALLRAQSLGVNYIRSRPALVQENEETKNLVIEYLAQGEKKALPRIRHGSLVRRDPTAGGGKRLHGPRHRSNEFHFCETSTFRPVETNRQGVFVAGPFTEPKDIPETVMQASGAAARVMSPSRDEKGSLIARKEFPAGAGRDGRGAAGCRVLIPLPGTDIASRRPARRRGLRENPSQRGLCGAQSLHLLERHPGEDQGEDSGICPQSCSRRLVHAEDARASFRATLREAGLNQYLFEMANIRDQCSWVHMHEYEKATQKSKDLVRMAVAKARLLDPLQTRSVPITKSTLVIGAGVAGMTSAVELADQGFDVYLVEREKEVGGAPPEHPLSD